MSKAYCNMCKAPFTSEVESFCDKCRAPRRKSCLLCGVAIPHNSQECLFCSAPQDTEIFNKIPLKACECKALLIMSSKVCYNCQLPQKVGYVLPKQSHLLPSSNPPEISSFHLQHAVNQNDTDGKSIPCQKLIQEKTLIEESDNPVTTLSSKQETPSDNVSITEQPSETDSSQQVTLPQVRVELRNQEMSNIVPVHGNIQQISSMSEQDQDSSISTTDTIATTCLDNWGSQQNEIPLPIPSNEPQQLDLYLQNESASINLALVPECETPSSKEASFPKISSQSTIQYTVPSTQSSSFSLPHSTSTSSLSTILSPTSPTTSFTVVAPSMLPLPSLSPSIPSGSVSCPVTLHSSSNQTCMSFKRNLSEREVITPEKKLKIDAQSDLEQFALHNVSEEKSAMATDSEEKTSDIETYESGLVIKNAGNQIYSSLSHAQQIPSEVQEGLIAESQFSPSRKRRNSPELNGTTAVKSKKIACATRVSTQNTSVSIESTNVSNKNDYGTPPTSPKPIVKSGEKQLEERKSEGATFVAVESDSDESPSDNHEQNLSYKIPASDESALFLDNNKKAETASKSKGKNFTNNPCIWSQIPKGLIATKCMKTVFFHAIIPVSLWGFDETSEVYIRFGSDKLGDWNCDVGPMKIKYWDSELYELDFNVTMWQSIASGGVPYKYCVYTPKTKSSKNSQYEHIRNSYKNYDDKFTNRYLKISSSEKTYHQYDTVIFPALSAVFNEEDKGVLQKLATAATSFVTSLFLGGSGTEAPSRDCELPTMEKTRALCLKIYLKGCFADLQSGHVVQPYNLIINICHVYNCLYAPIIHFQRSNFSSDTQEWKYSNLKHDLKKLLIPIAEELNSAQNVPSVKKIIVGTVIVCILNETFKTDTEIGLDYVVAVIRLLTFTYDFKKDNYQDFYGLLNDTQLQMIITESIVKYAGKLLKAKNAQDHLYLLFNLLTFSHFINKCSEPFGDSEKNPENITWRSSLSSGYFADLEVLLKKLGPKDVLALYSKLEANFIIDPLLLPEFVCICPSSFYMALFEVLPPFYSVARLACLSKQSSAISNASEVPGLLSLIHSQLLKMTKQQEIMQVLNATLYLVEVTKVKISKPSDPYPEIFTKLMSLFLEILTKISDYKHKIDEALKITHETVNQWIKGNIGGSMFGKEISSLSSTKHLVKLKEEFKVWEHILLIPCPKNLIMEWTAIISSIVKERVSKVPANFVVDLLEFTEDNSISPVLTEAVMDNIKLCLDELISSDASAESFKKILKSKHFTKLGNILSKKYRKKDLSIDDILEWEAWPGFINIYVQQRVLCKEGLSKTDQDICDTAIFVFTSVCMTVLDGSVTFDVLHKLQKRQILVEKLCQAIFSNTCDIESSLKVQTLSFREVISTLEVRLKEYETFSLLRDQISTLSCHVPEVIVPELSIVQEIPDDISLESISSLCKLEGSKIVHCYFDCVSPLFHILPQFICLMQTNQSDTFQTFWKSQVDKYKRKKLCCDEVVSLIWEPVFKRICRFLCSLKNKSVSLVTLDKLKKVFSSDQQNKFETEFRSLEVGISKCLNRTCDITWIEKCVEKIFNYYSLHQIANAAAIFLKLKKVLGLTGNFELIENLADKFEDSVKDQSLQYINDDLVQTGEFLSDVSSYPIRLDCLKAFIECHSIIQWIRDVTSDVQDLQHFVTIALATASAGEDDYTRDRLSNLRTIGSGFSRLIYSLPPDTNYMQLVRYCTSLWDMLKRDADLPQKLRDCNEQIEWYKSVKEMQGSVEKSSFGQMNNIKKYGCYTVSSRPKGAQLKPSELIHLYLEERDKPLAQQKYSLDELRDLESKLVLITGKESEERSNVEHFLKVFNTVCHITDVLIQLLQHGHNKYMGWVLKFPCTLPKDDDDIVDKLTDILNEMTTDLEEWQDKVAEARNQFYCLNYFTTRQLLLLRKELSYFSNPDYCGDLKPDVISLLQSVSKDVSPKLIVSHIREISDDLEDTGETRLTSDDTINESYASDTGMNESNREVAAITSKFLLSSVPQPQLSDCDLTDKQNAILDNLIESFGFSKKLVLLAFERIAKPDIEEEVQKWCIQHEDKYIFHEEVNEIDLSLEKLDIDENESLTHTDHQLIDLEIGKKKMAIAVCEVFPVNEEHPDVKSMLLSGYSLEQALEAVERFPDNIQKAMEYIDYRDENDSNDKMEDGLFSEAVMSSLGRQQSTGSYAGDLEIVCDVSVRDFLTLGQLAKLLEKLSNKYTAPVTFERNFGEVLKKGVPNLIIVSPEDVLKTVLSLYMESQDLPLPSYEEVLLCNELTTAEEVALLWKRAMGDPNHFRIFCLVHAELLSYQVCDNVFKSLHDFSQGSTEYKLVIVCSSEDQHKSHIITKLQIHKRPFSIIHEDTDFSQYLNKHFTNWPKSSIIGHNIVASVVDPENSCVRVVSSNRAGMGKSLYIQRMKEELRRRKCSSDISDVVIPVHGPRVTFDDIIKSLKKPFNNKQDNNGACIFHFDISPNVLRLVDSILFSLLILQAASDSQGRIWRCHPTHLYAIEATILNKEDIIAKSSITLLNLLPTIECQSPNDVLKLLRKSRKGTSTTKVDAKEFKSEQLQRVYQYLKRHMSNVSLDRFTYVHNPEAIAEKPLDCLQLYLKYCGLKDPSWSELKHFVEFLNIQLESCENSVFCKEEAVGDVMSGLKTFVVKFMIRMSKDFATSSLRGEVAAENQEGLASDDQLQLYEIDERKQWEQSYHPYLFFNKDGASITFVGFNVNPTTGDIQDPIKKEVIEHRAMTPQLYTGLQCNRVNLSENYQSWGKDTMIQKIGMVMGLEWSYDPDSSYVLTVDNVIKIMAIHMRFRCNIPVIIMGETGCGKTRLIRYMCNIVAQCCRNGGSDVHNMLIMKVHGGTTESDVIKVVEKAEGIASTNRKEHEIDTVLFFDEANTSDAIGLIKEVMCDRRINGRLIKEDVKFIAACNPYRKHTNDMILKLESAGLGFFVKATDTQQKLGKIPLRQLVYRVLDLPPSMRPLVYDFGQLNNDTEKDYTFQIVTDRCQNITEVKSQTRLIQSVADVLAWSQKYMRERNDECSFVSLRDVERAMIVFKYFCEKKDMFSEYVYRKAEEEEQEMVSDITRSLILAICVCYHARLQDRNEYETGVVQQFNAPLAVIGRKQFCNEIRWCQDVLLDNMKLGPNIARNAALRENVFMMAICIELRIPLFLVGKPGSSKSLAKSIVADSMIGRLSDVEFIRGFKEVHMFSYQCSQLSTPESVIEIFNTAKGFQKKDFRNYVSVVVLDEVGLAEDSPNLPLKALHPLLEDGTEGADGSEQIIEHDKRVAFIGISNWALDPAKMNRGVMVTRGDPDVNELVASAKGICSNVTNDPVKDKLSIYFEPLATAYKEICEKQEKKQKPFFGLRDFYSLIKMLYWMCKKSNMPLSGPQLQHAVKRNFGGLDIDEIDTYKIFKHYLKHLDHEPDLSTITDESLRNLLLPDCSPLGLIRKSLQTKEVSWHGENRYLLFLTENYAALEVIKYYLHEEVGLSKVRIRQDLHLRAEEFGLKDSLGSRVDDSLKARSTEKKMEPFVLFGSSFPKDREYTQVCRNINQIKICMETGRTVILLNLENLYESLYDLLNQYYIHHGDQRYVDLGLQTHRVKCRVHHNFKLILIAEKSTVYRKFPTPLINRLEKHFVLSETVLLEWQVKVLERLIDWVDKFSKINDDSKFTKQDAFIGYKNDTPASVIFQATHIIKQEGQYIENCEDFQEGVLECGKMILLQMASPEALIRLKNTSLMDEQKHLSQTYFFEQHHGSIVDFLNYHLQNSTHGSSGLLIQITTHSNLFSKHEVNDLYYSLYIKNGGCYLLQEFDTEMNFSHKISPSFSDKDESLLIVQCDSGHLYGDLLACARYRIDDEREKSKLRHKAGEGITHVLFIVHISRQIEDSISSFVGFQGGSWISAHIDDIRPPSESDLTLDDAQNAPISHIFYNGQFLTDEEMEIEHSSQQLFSFIMNEDSDNEMVVESQSVAKPKLYTDENEDISDNMLHDHGATVEDLEELPSDESIADVMNETISLDMEEVSDEIQVHSAISRIPPLSKLKKHSQCSRLYSCIQAAVASLMEISDSKKQTASVMRVKILLKHIPQNPSLPLDTKTFYGALVKHVKNLLEEREGHFLDSNWVLKEAMSGKRLQSGGTFQNVLSRKLDEVIVPIFTAVLLFVDQYSNLSILDSSSAHIKKFWHGIFSNEKVVQFSYQNYALGMGIGYQDLRVVPGIGQIVAVETEFDCRFPFFWLVKEAFESKWDLVKSLPGDHRQEIQNKLCNMLHDDPVVSVLMKVPEEHWSELCQLYFYDILRSAHSVPHHKASDEYEILNNSLIAIINGPDLSPHKSLLSLLAGVHVVCNEYQQEIMWFGQLTAHIPGILVWLIKEDFLDCQYFKLPLHAVKVSIRSDHLALQLSPDEREYIPQRILKLQLCQNSIDSILALAPENDLTQEIRVTWQRVRAVQLFIEHVAMKCSLDTERFIIFVQYANRINVRLTCEFVKKEAISNVEKVLRIVDREAKSKLRYAVNMQNKVRECCKSYFMAVVSSLCFGQTTPPEPELITELLNIVITEKNKTKEFTYSEEEKTDEVPVIRSFLLQLLLEHNMEEVKDHLTSYFRRAQNLIQNDYDLCLLCIQCLEDAIYKQHGHASLQIKVEKALSTLKTGKELVSQSNAPDPGSVINLEYLEGIAMLRYSLTVIAELIYYQYSNEEREGTTYTLNTQLLLDMAKKCCTERNLNENDTGPGVFLVKQLVKQYGVAFLTNLTSDDTMQWVVPQNLRQSDHEEAQQVNDPFVIYNDYSEMQTILANAVYGKDFTQLQKAIQNFSSAHVIPLLLGVYQVITGSAVFTVESKVISDEIKDEVFATIRNCKGLKRELLWIVQHFIKDTYYGRLELMTLRPGMIPRNRLLIDLVVHVATVMQFTSDKLLTPFIQMMGQPGDLKNCFLPTMPEDSLPIVRTAIGNGQFYECPRGHPYFVSECGKPTQQYTCPTCHSCIGGQNHQLESTNRLARKTDITETGYALGQPYQRESIPSTERSLSIQACAIIRALMHSSLLWGSCTNEHAMIGLLDLIKTQVRPNDVSLFFWQHLLHDIKMLSTTLGKSEDDVCLILHIILKNIATFNPTGRSAANLVTKGQRNAWENFFTEAYIKPVLTNLDIHLCNATALQLNNKREDRDRLFYIIHEKVQLPPNVIVPHLWSYHSRITLKHLLQVLQPQKETHPILYEFLTHEKFLRATHYIPAIITLQQQMFKMSHKRIDKKEAAQVTVQDYLKGLKQQQRTQFQDKINCVIKAWNLVKEKLRDARVQVDPHIVKTLTWDENTPLSYFIPTLTGDGVCTVALVSLLVSIHNDFLGKCHSQSKNKQKRNVLCKVPASQIQLCHLLEYEHQITSIVLSHCHYSLKHGKGHDVSYDFSALEKHIVDRFLHGKPYILLEIPQVIYRKDVYTAEAFASIRRNVKPQIQLTTKEQIDIVNELGSIQHLRECLDVVEIVIGFLSSGKSDSKTEIKMYIKRVLRMDEKRFTSKKALEYCTLGHILSLWETLSVQVAKCLTIKKQEAFDSFNEELMSVLQKKQKDQLLSYLEGINVPPFLNLLYEFIETTVRHYESQDINITWPLRDTLKYHLENCELEQLLPENFQEKFPESITVAQSVEAWKIIVIFQHKHEKNIA